MRRILSIVAGALVMMVASVGHAQVTEKQYVAGAAGVTISQPGIASVNEAGGAVDCANGLGGVCFDMRALGAQPNQQFTITAIDGASGKVGLFMGFDMDGDGCVACKNGAPGLGADNDVFFQGSGQITGQVPCVVNADGFCGLPNDATLYVFVRLLTLNSADPGTTGTITITPGCGQPQPGKDCVNNFDKNMGQVCVGGDPARPGQCGQVMYPYPGV